MVSVAMNFIIPGGEMPETRPALWLPQREGYTAEWLQNVPIAHIWYRFSRNEGEESILRKRYTRELYDPTWLLFREPKASGCHSTEDLIALGLIGVYGWRRHGG
jgi:hypothetical protein